MASKATLLRRIMVADLEWKAASKRVTLAATRWRRLVTELEGDIAYYFCNDCMTVCTDRFCAARHVKQFPGHKSRPVVMKPELTQLSGLSANEAKEET